MAQFAEINSDNEVIRVIEVDDNDVANNGGDASTEAATFVGSKFKLSSINNSWVQSSPTGSFRQRPASVGGSYDAAKDVFISVRPYNSWSLNSNNVWVAPVIYSNEDYSPAEGVDGIHRITWDEVNQKWTAFAIEGGDTTNLEWNTETSAWVVV